MRKFRLVRFVLLLLSLVAFCCSRGRAQSDSAEISGRVTDPSGALIRGADVQLRDIARGTVATTKSNHDGIYIFPFVQPGRYSVSVGALGFKSLDLVSLTANAQDHIQQNFRLPVGAPSESVTVTSDAKVDLDTGVSTSVDQNFIENMPLNGQSIQQLIAITPGVQRTAGAGQFSFNGVRDNQNYITVDGVSGNTGTTPVTGGLGQQGAGQVGGYSALLTSSSLASLGDIQEIKIQSSSYTAEFGRGAGGQISLTTQSGSNVIHGGLFEYLRNTDFDAYNSYTKFQYAQLLSVNASAAALSKPVERQNDFGGTLGGPIVIPHLYDGHSRSFFFFSTEALILKQPVSLATNVPGPCARTNSCTLTGIPSTPSNPQPPAPPIAAPLAPYFVLAPPPNYIPAKITFANIPQYLGTYSNPSTAYATSLRLTHQITSKVSAFVRASYSPSALEARQANNTTDTKFNQKSYTLGVNALITSHLSNEIRLNYTRNSGENVNSLDDYAGGTVPTAAMLAQMFPAQYGSSPLSDNFTFGETVGTQWGNYSFQYGTNVQNTQRQVNLVDNVSLSEGRHSFRFGGDWRRLTPIAAPYHYGQQVNYSTILGYSIPNSTSITGINSGIPDAGFAQSQDKVVVLINNVSLFAQDSWRVSPRFTLNYGVRWDINPAPRGDGSQQLYGVLSVVNPATATLAPGGTQLFPTDYKAFQPRAGVAYELRGKANWETLLRVGFGLYYDTYANTATNATSYYPHQRVANLYGVPWPTTALPPPPGVSYNPPYTNQNILGFEPGFTVPRTWEWSLSLQQGLGRNQSVQISYVGSAGRDLARFSAYSGSGFNNRFLNMAVYSSLDYSNYDSLQVAYKRNLYKGLQVLANYTWAKSLDTTTNETSSAPNPMELNINNDYGLSVFDVRHNLNASVAYDFPTIQRAWAPVRYALKDWSVDEIFLVHSGNPLTASFNEAVGNYTTTTYRPNIVKGQPLWVSTPNSSLTFPSCVVNGVTINSSAGQQVFPQLTFGHKALNPLAFDTCFAAGATTPVQGNEPRGYITGLAVRNLDATVRREFTIHGAAHLQFRVDAFNVLNQTLYQNPNAILGSYVTPTSYQESAGNSQYGTIQNTLNSSNTAGSNSIGGGYYGIGRSRSLQLALKLKF
jgi:hypothetical protein